MSLTNDLIIPHKQYLNDFTFKYLGLLKSTKLLLYLLVNSSTDSFKKLK